jgi:hypothetical protein
MSKFKNRRIIRVKVETTYNTDAAPANADSLQVADFTWKFADTKIAERAISSGTKTPAPAIYAGALLEMTFECELKGSGTAGTAGDLSAILQAAGMKETITGGVSVVYKNDSVAEKSATIWFKDGGDEDEWRITGCRGQVSLEIVAGEFAKLKFTMRGHHTQNPTATAAWVPVYDTTIPVPVLNVPLVIGGTTFDQSKIAIDMGNEIAAPAILNAADGFGEVRITKRAPKLSATIFPPAAATASPVADFKSNTVKTLTMAAVGSVAGNKFQFTFPGGGKFADGPSDGDSNGIVSYDVAFNLIESALGADDEFSLTLT